MAISIALFNIWAWEAKPQSECFVEDNVICSHDFFFLVVTTTYRIDVMTKYTSIAQHHQQKQSGLKKIDKGLEQTFYRDVQMAVRHEKMLNITHRWRNANSNCNEILYHIP